MLPLQLCSVQDICPAPTPMLTSKPSPWWLSVASPSQLDASTGTDDDAIMHREQSTAPDVVELSRFPFSTAGTRIHLRPLARTDSSALGGIHAWAFVRATTPGASTLSAAIPVLLSILLMWGQSVILNAPTLETMEHEAWSV